MKAEEWAHSYAANPVERERLTKAFTLAQQEARAERDREWVGAVRHMDDHPAGAWLWCGNCDNPMDPAGGEPFCQCAWSARLRALLEGK